MAAPGQEIIIKDALVFLVAAGLVVPLLNKLKIPTITGFILTGIFLGVSGLSIFSATYPVLDYFTISDPKAIAPFAELGVLFLLFLLGLEMSVEKLWALRRIVFGVGLFQVAISATLIALFIAAFGYSASLSILIGLALSLSSTAIVMQLLIDQRKLSTPIGKTSLGVLLIQDVLVAPILIFAAFIGLHAGSNLTSELVSAFTQGFVAIAVIILLGRFVLRPVFHQAAIGGRGNLMAVTLLTILGAAVLTGMAGLSVALGAFLAGLLLGETEFKHQAELDLEPFKGLLLGLFFMTVGLSLDVSVIIERWEFVLGTVLALLALKAGVIYLAVRFFLGGKKLSIEAAFILAPAGEFAFVALAAGVGSGALDTQTSSLFSAIAAISMVFIPALWVMGKRLGAIAVKEADDPDLLSDVSDKTDHVVIIGFGRVGQTTARLLSETDVSLVALETNSQIVREQKQKGHIIYYGNGAREDALLKAGVNKASLVIITVDDAKSAEIITKACQKIRADLPVYVRAQDVDHAKSLYAAGANFVVPDAIEAALQMSGRALEDIGYDLQTVRDILAKERADAYREGTDASE